MTEKEFVNCMNYIRGLFPGWKFDTTDPLALRSWYRKLGMLYKTDLLYCIDKYSDTNQFPPQSPASLLQVLCDDADRLALQPGDAWRTVVDLISAYGFIYHRDDLYRALEAKRNPALSAAVREMESELAYSSSDDTYLIERFKKNYAERIKAETVEQKLARIGYDLNPQIGGENKNALPEASVEQMYEAALKKTYGN